MGFVLVETMLSLAGIERQNRAAASLVLRPTAGEDTLLPVGLRNQPIWRRPLVRLIRYPKRVELVRI